MQILKYPAISFEFFPPKTPEGMAQLGLEASELNQYNPLYMSVTYGAGGSTRQGTIETVQMLQAQTTTLLAPHLACAGSTRFEIVNILQQYIHLGVRRVVALRGDLPSGAGHIDELPYASDLVNLVREETGNHFHIEVAAYPEIHPQAMSVNNDLQNLKRKYDAGADSAITQYFFNPDAYFYYIDECARLGIDMPIIPGIMPITQLDRLARFSDMCGAEIPRWIRKRLESCGDDIAAAKAFGLEVVYKLCDTLLRGGAPGLHFYTLNRAEATCSLISQLGVMQEKSFASKTVTIVR